MSRSQWVDEAGHMDNINAFKYFTPAHEEPAHEWSACDAPLMTDKWKQAFMKHSDELLPIIAQYGLISPEKILILVYTQILSSESHTDPSSCPHKL